MDLYKILETIAVPRPNHSDAVDKTAAYLKGLLTSWNIPFDVQHYTLRPYEHLLVGYACFFLALLALYFVIKQKPLPILAAALAIPVLMILEYEFFIPVVSPLITKGGQNLIVSFNAPDAMRELVFAAHYDSKTDFFDHLERAKIYRFIPVAGVLGMLMALWVKLRTRMKALRKPFFAPLTVAFAALLAAYWGLVALGMGGYIFLSKQSCGAVDDGGAVVTLLGLAKNIKEGKVNTGKSNITIIFMSGEEVGPQGSYWYVKKRFRDAPAKPSLPVSLVNLELVGQNGTMVYWRKYGVFLSFKGHDQELEKRIAAAWKDVAGKPPVAGGAITDDAYHFINAGIPAITVGHTGIPGLGEGGFHDVTDCMDRVNRNNLYLMVKTLGKYIEGY